MTLPQVLKWASISDEVRVFFKQFRMEGPEMISIKTLQDDELIVYEKHLSEQNPEKAFPSDVVQFVSKQAAQLT